MSADLATFAALALATAAFLSSVYAVVAADKAHAAASDAHTRAIAAECALYVLQRSARE